MIIFIYAIFAILAMLVISVFLPGFSSDLNISFYLSVIAIFALSALVIIFRKILPSFKTFSVYIAIFLSLFIVAEGSLIYFSGNEVPTGNEQAIIVAGSGLFVESRMTSELQKRLDLAIEIYGENPHLPIVLSGGTDENRTLPQSTAMKAYLDKKIKELGLASPIIIIDDQSNGLYNNISTSFDKLTENVPEPLSADTPSAYIIVSRHNVPTAKLIKNKISSDSTVIGAEYPISKYTIYYIRETGHFLTTLIKTGIN